MGTENLNKEVYGQLWNHQMVNFKTTGPGSRWMFDLLDDMVNCVDTNVVKTVIDVGCGEGTKTYFLKTRFEHANVLGTDLTEEGVKVASEYFGDVPNLEFKCLEASDMTVWDRQYDLISCFEVLEHLGDWQSLVDRFTASSSRYILISVPVGRMRGYESGIGHVRNFKKGQIESYLAGQGFKPVKVYYAGFPFFNPIIRDAAQIVYTFKKSKQIFSEKIQHAQKPSIATRIYSNLFYFLFRYCSSKHNLGEQFLGLFEKN